MSPEFYSYTFFPCSYAGLQLAIERSKSVGRFGHRTAAYLSDIANTYDTFGKILVKAAQSIHPDVWKASANVDGGGDSDTKDASSSSSDSNVAQSCYDSVREMGISSRRLAEYYRTRLVLPLKTTITANRAVLDTHGQRYVAARAQCFETRRRALVARTKLVRAVNAAEKSFRRWKKARGQAVAVAVAPSGGDGDSTVESPPEAPEWEKTIRVYGKAFPTETDQLVKRLHDVETARSRYEELVDNENDAVLYAQQMEATVLNTIQDVERTRIRFFFESVVKPICATDADTLSKVSLVHERNDSRASINEEASALDLKKGKDLLANIFARQAISYEEGMGRTDAETLGLPLASGSLRDDVKKQVAGIAARIKAAQILTEFLESFGSAFMTLEVGLKIDSLPTNARQEPLGVMAFNAVGPVAAEVWRGVVKLFEDEAVTAGELASTAAKLRLQKLEVFLETAQKDLKAEKDYDETNWKTLCEIARTESKAASRYRQVRAQQEKARERVLSADLAKGEETTGVEEDNGPSTPQKNRMSKAFFAGGEAMKKFQENARMAMAKSSLQEAEQNAVKEQQLLDEATATKSQAINDYKRVTETRVQKLESINKQVKKDLEKIMEAIVLGIGRLRKARANGLDRPLDGGKVSLDSLMKDVDEWVQSAMDRMEANRKIAVIDESEEKDGGNGEGFRLSVMLPESEFVDNLFKLTDSTIPPPDFISKLDDSLGTESSEDELDIRGVDSSFESIGSGASAGPSAQTSNGEDKVRDLRHISVPGTPGSVSDEKKAAMEHSDSNFEETTSVNAKKHMSHDMQVFMRHFGQDKDVSDKAPEILQIISCAYRPKEKGGFLIPALHGRLYTTSEKLYFLALDGKHFVLAWQDVVNVTTEKGFMGKGDSAILVTYTASDIDAAFVLSRMGSKDRVLTHLQKLLLDLQARNVPPAEQADGKALPSVPPDSLLQKMEIVLSKQLRGVSIKQVYEKAWSEGNRTSEKPFYAPWLDQEECFDITVEDWEFAEPESEGFLGPWCKERYTQKRLTTFKFKRTTHLYIGPPVAFVKQMHYCRVEGNDKCVVAISATFEGIPYSDAFAVEMRWVARRHHDHLDIKVGLEVDFKKSTMLKSQIRSGTITETKNVHMRMFDAIKKVCKTLGDSSEIDMADTLSDNEEEEEVEDEDEDEELEKTQGLLARILESFTLIPVNPNFLLFTAATMAYPVLFNFFSALLGAPALSMNEAHRLNTEVQELRAEVRELRASLDMAIEFMKKRN